MVRVSCWMPQLWQIKTKTKWRENSNTVILNLNCVENSPSLMFRNEMIFQTFSGIGCLESEDASSCCLVKPRIFFFIPFHIVMFYCVIAVLRPQLLLLRSSDLFLYDECVPRCCQWFFFIPLQFLSLSLLFCDYCQKRWLYDLTFGKTIEISGSLLYGDNMNNWRTNAHYPNFFPFVSHGWPRWGCLEAGRGEEENVHSSG